MDNRLEIRIVDDGRPAPSAAPPPPTGFGAPPPLSGAGSPTPTRPSGPTGRPATPSGGLAFDPAQAPPVSGGDPMAAMREMERQAAAQGNTVNRLFRASREAWARSQREMRDRLEEEVGAGRDVLTHQQRLRKQAADERTRRNQEQQAEINQTRQALQMSPKLALTGAALAAISATAVEISNLLIKRIQRDAEAATARLSGDYIGGEIALLQKQRETLEGGARAGGGFAGAIGGGAAGFALGGPVGGLVGTLAGLIGGKQFASDIAGMVGIGLDQEIAVQSAFRQQQAAFRARTDELSQYDPRLARETAQGRVAKQLRDIGEARIASEQFGQLASRQRELDTLQQQLNVLENLKKAQQQTNETNDKIKELQEQLNKKLASVDKSIADAVRKLGDQRSPLDILIQQGIAAPQGMGEPAGGINPFPALRDSALAIPLINDWGDL